YACPVAIDAGGCSETLWFGITQATFGRLPPLASSKKSPTERMLPSWPSCRTVVNHGSGFQMPGVAADWEIGAQVASPSSQSGSVPGKTYQDQLMPPRNSNEVMSVQA